MILFFQIVALLIGGGIYCLQAVYREKDLNTFDYQRITRMTPLELSVGKLLVAPALPYFAFSLLTPIAAGPHSRQIPVSVFLQNLTSLSFGGRLRITPWRSLFLYFWNGALRPGHHIFLLFVGMSSIDFSQARVRLGHELSHLCVKLLSLMTPGQTGPVSNCVGIPKSVRLFLRNTVPHFWSLLSCTDAYRLVPARFGQNIKRDRLSTSVFACAGICVRAVPEFVVAWLLPVVVPHVDTVVPPTHHMVTTVRSIQAAQPRSCFSASTFGSCDPRTWHCCAIADASGAVFAIRLGAGWRAAVGPAPYLFAGAVLTGLAIHRHDPAQAPDGP